MYSHVPIQLWIPLLKHDNVRITPTNNVCILCVWLATDIIVHTILLLPRRFRAQLVRSSDERIIE